MRTLGKAALREQRETIDAPVFAGQAFRLFGRNYLRLDYMTIIAESVECCERHVTASDGGDVEGNAENAARRLASLDPFRRIGRAVTSGSQ